MAITNAQQYKQLVNPPMEGKKRPGYRGDAAYGKDSGSAQAREIGQARGQTGPGRRNEAMGDGPATGTPVRYDPQKALDAAIAQGKFDEKNPIQKAVDTGISILGKSLYNRFPNDPKNELDFLRSLPTNQRALLSPALRAKLEAIEEESEFDDYTTASKKFTAEEFQDLVNFQPTQGENFAEYMATKKGSLGLLKSGNVGNFETFVTKRDAEGRPIEYGYREKRGDGDGADEYQRRLEELRLAAMTPAVSNIIEPPKPFSPNLRLLADGGMTEDAPVEGGIMDLESGRQMYFLGKLVKKATRAVKKIVKSPVGKLALFAGLGAYGLGKGPFASVAGSGFLKAKSPLMMKLFKEGTIGSGLTGTGMLTLGGGLTLAPFLIGEEEEQQQKTANLGATLPYPIDYYLSGQYNANPRLLADGGKAEPVAKKTMPLLDMDGKEKDYRETGGFVDMGRMERADDVPARLSKNEFVFTADAVRNAGDGSVDKGAEVMYNMMKNLEAGGEVSEESQGLKGARKMFQTSQRLEEVL